MGHLSKTPLNLLEIHKIGSVDTFESKQQNCDQIWHLWLLYQKLLVLSHFSWLSHSPVGHCTTCTPVVIHIWHMCMSDLNTPKTCYSFVHQQGCSTYQNLTHVSCWPLCEIFKLWYWLMVKLPCQCINWDVLHIKISPIYMLTFVWHFCSLSRLCLIVHPFGYFISTIKVHKLHWLICASTGMFSTSKSGISSTLTFAWHFWTFDRSSLWTSIKSWKRSCQQFIKGRRNRSVCLSQITSTGWMTFLNFDTGPKPNYLTSEQTNC